MNFRDFIASKVEMNVTQFLNLYLSENDRESFEGAIKLHVYADGMPIEQLPDFKYRVQILNRIFESESLEKLEQLLWDDFAEVELN